MEVSILDVMQIFGRAGRPQFDTRGEAFIITAHDQLGRYLALMQHQAPIESSFARQLVDNLNAELVLGTVTNVREACVWLSYTYLHVRMLRNPLAYGLPWNALDGDPALAQHRKELITTAARRLAECRMAVFDEKSGNLYVTEMGRVASHYYIQHGSIETYNERLKPHMSRADLFEMLSLSAEFANVRVRDDEVPELEKLQRRCCEVDVRGGLESAHGKANLLMQCYVSRARPGSFSLVMDMAYMGDNCPRIARALFEICLRRGWSSLTEMLLTLCKSLEKQLWPHAHPLFQVRRKGPPSSGGGAAGHLWIRWADGPPRGRDARPTDPLSAFPSSSSEPPPPSCPSSSSRTSCSGSRTGAPPTTGCTTCRRRRSAPCSGCPTPAGPSRRRWRPCRRWTWRPACTPSRAPCSGWCSR